jgi:tRNA nucleotidyltransferase (CCA-adding enzyme)
VRGLVKRWPASIAGMALVAVSLVLYAVDGHVVMALIAAATLAVMAVVLRRMDPPGLRIARSKRSWSPTTGQPRGGHAMTLSDTDRFVVSLGFPTFKVGGAVRDKVMGRTPKDVDYMVVEQPPEIIAAVKEAKHKAQSLKVRDRVVGVRVTGPRCPVGGIEIVPPRIDKAVSAAEGGPRSRHDFLVLPHPSARPMASAEEIESMVGEDARRRDFTVNALYERLDSRSRPQLLDPLGRGVHDAVNRLLNVIGNESFGEDPLRVLRGLRFVSQCGLEPLARTLSLMREYAPQIDALTQKGVSSTVRDELDKLLMGDDPERALHVAVSVRAFGHWLPELEPMVWFDQQHAAHALALHQHAFRVVALVAKQCGSLRARRVALGHDIGKVTCNQPGKRGGLMFAGHEDESARVIDRMCRRMLYPTQERLDWVLLTREHGLEAAGSRRPHKARMLRLRLRADASLIEDLLVFGYADRGADRLSERVDTSDLDRLAGMLAEVSSDPVSVRDLAVDGAMLQAQAMIPSGRAMGEVLRLLLSDVQRDPALNRPDWLLWRARKLYQEVGRP